MNPGRDSSISPCAYCLLYVNNSRQGNASTPGRDVPLFTFGIALGGRIAYVTKNFNSGTLAVV